MKQLELDLEYLKQLNVLIAKVILSTNIGKAVVAGGAIRDMLFNKPVSDIDVFYEGEIDEAQIKQHFPNNAAPNTAYPDGFSVTHNILDVAFPVKIQLIQVKDITKHIATFPSPMMRLWFDLTGLHGLESDVIGDAQNNMFFWDQKVDLGYFLKIKDKYSDWEHAFIEGSFNPEFVEQMEVDF